MTTQNPRTDSSTEPVKENTRPGKFPALPKEVGGRKGPEPTRYGDWEKDGIASDF